MGPDRISAVSESEAFVRAETRLNRAPLVPELVLHLADEVVPLWQMTEDELTRTGLPPPYWAFAWAGGQALARYVLDHPACARGRDVLDFAAGSGIAGLAAAKAGAAHVLAADIDPLAVAACRVNAAANGLTVTVSDQNLLDAPPPPAQLVLAGDICYEEPLAARVEAWLRVCAGRGATVLLGDPGRTYAPRSGLEELAQYAVQTTRELEDADVRNARVWRVLP